MTGPIGPGAFIAVVGASGADKDAWQPVARAEGGSPRVHPEGRTFRRGPQPHRPRCRLALALYVRSAEEHAVVVVAASAGSPRTPSIEVGDYRRLPASRDEPQLGYLSEIQGIWAPQVPLVPLPSGDRRRRRAATPARTPPAQLPRRPADPAGPRGSSRTRGAGSAQRTRSRHWSLPNSAQLARPHPAVCTALVRPPSNRYYRPRALQRLPLPAFPASGS